jgi:hypothetical protein
MARGLLGERGNVQPAETDVRSTPAVLVRQLVGAAGGRDVDLNHDQLGVVVQVERLDVLVLKRDLIIGVEIRRERGEAEGWEEGIFDRPEERALRFGKRREDQLDSHRGAST